MKNGWETSENGEFEILPSFLVTGDEDGIFRQFGQNILTVLVRLDEIC